MKIFYTAIVLTLPFLLSCSPPEDDTPQTMNFTQETTSTTATIAITLNGTSPINESLDFIIVDPPQFGTLTGTGNILNYTPGSDFSVSDRFTYNVKGASGLVSALTSVSIIYVVGDTSTIVLVAENKIYYLPSAEQTLTLSLQQTNTNISNFTIVSPPQFGAITGEDLKNLVYTPNSDFLDKDSFTYSFSDGGNTSQNGTVFLFLQSSTPSDTLTVENIALQINEGGSVSFALEASQNNVQFIIVSAPSFGQLEGSGQNKVYTANDNFVDSDTITFQAVNEDKVLSNTASISITLFDKPVAQNGEITISKGNATTVVLAASGEYSDFEILSHPLLSITKKSLATYLVSTTQTTQISTIITFRAIGVNSNFSNIATISVTILDEVPSDNILPETATNNYNFQVGGQTSIAVLLSATDSDGLIEDYQYQQPNNGTLTGTPPNLTYTPNAGFDGVDSFTFTVVDNEGGVSLAATNTINVIPESNFAPIANSSTVTTRAGQTITFALDVSDANDDSLTITLLSTPANGDLSIQNSTAYYTPNSNYSGTDTFQFYVADSYGLSATASIKLLISHPVKGAATVFRTKLGDGNINVSVVDATGFEGDAITHGDRISNVFIDNTAEATLNQLTQEVFMGSVAYSLDDISVNINGMGLINQYDEYGGGIVFSSTDASPGYDSTDSGSPWELIDGRPFHNSAIEIGYWLQNKDILFIKSAENRTQDDDKNAVYCEDYTLHNDLFIPICGSSSDFIAHTGIGLSQTIFVGAIDTENNYAQSALKADGVFEKHAIYVESPDGSTSQASPVLAAYAAKLLAENPTWSMAQVRAQLFALASTESIDFSDGAANEDSAIILLKRTIKSIRPIDLGINFLPEVASETITLSLSSQSSVVINLQITDKNDTSFSYNYQQPSNGTVTGDSGTLTYTPNADFSGDDSFTFSVTDGEGAISNTGTIKITVEPSINDAPKAIDGTAKLRTGASVTINLQVSDININDTLTISLTSTPTKGTIVLQGSSATFTSHDTSFGTETFQFQVTDSYGETAAASIELSISHAVTGSASIFRTELGNGTIHVSVVDGTGFDGNSLTHGDRISEVLLQTTDQSMLTQITQGIGGFPYFINDKATGTNGLGMITHYLDHTNGIVFSATDNSPAYSSSTETDWQIIDSRPFFIASIELAHWLKTKNILFISALENATSDVQLQPIYCDDYDDTQEFFIPLCGSGTDYIAHSKVAISNTIFVGAINNSDIVEFATAAIKAGGPFDDNALFVESPDGSTSQATPVLTGYATNLWFENPTWTMQQLRSELFSRASTESINFHTGEINSNNNAVFETRIIKVLRPDAFD